MTFGILREPYGSPVVQGFVDAVASVFAAAEADFAAKGAGSLLLGGNQYVAYASLALGSALAAFMYPHTLTGIFASNSGNTIRKSAVLLPAYTLVLKLAAFFYVVPRTLVWIGFVIAKPGFRTPDAIAHQLMGIWLTALHLVVAITAIFAVMEWRQRQSRAWETWTASQLVEHERDPNEIPRSQSIAELVGGLIGAWWWLTLVGSPSSYRLEDTFQITLWPLYSWAYWPILVFLLAGVVLASVNLFRPSWTRERAGARLAIDALGLVLAAVIALGPFVDVTAASPKPGAADLAKWANLFWDITAWSIAISCAARMIQDVRRIVGKKPIRNPAMSALGAN